MICCPINRIQHMISFVSDTAELHLSAVTACDLRWSPSAAGAGISQGSNGTVEAVTLGDE